MTAKTSKETVKAETVMDDVFEDKAVEAKAVVEAIVDIDDDKLAKLKARLAGQSKEKVVKKERSINFGCVGLGQAGSRIVEQFYALGIDAIAINSGKQDLEHIKMPESNKLLLEYSGFGGAAKNLELGRSIAEYNRGLISATIDKHFSNIDMFLVATSLSGGSGAGAMPIVIDILSEKGKPVIVINVLPMNSDDTISKSNALETLHTLTGLMKTGKVANAIVVDNARLEALFSNIPITQFFGVANKAIVGTFDAFNRLSMLPSSTKAFDSMELIRLLTAPGFTVCGEVIVKDYLGETAIAENVISNLTNNLLSNDFDIKQSKYAGFIIAANAKVLNSIPSVAISYANSLLDETAGSPLAVFKGLYEIDDPEDVVHIYSIFAGMGIPTNRIEALKKESAALTKVAQDKDAQTNNNLNFDLGKSDTMNDLQKIKDKVAGSKSIFSNMINKNVIDRRGK